MCRQLDHDASDSDSSDQEANYAQIFQSAITHYVTNAPVHSPTETTTDPDNDEPVCIFSVYSEFTLPSGKDFIGDCIDSGAQRTVIGRQQATEYTEITGTTRMADTNSGVTKFIFGDSSYDGLGRIVIRIPIINDYFVDIMAQIVNVDVPLLLGLDVLERLKIVLYFNDYSMSSIAEDWTVPLIMKNGHAYVVWCSKILYSEAELRKMHRHFYHPSTDKLYAVIKRAEPATTNTGMYDLLENVRDTCDKFQRNAAEPHRFRVSLPTEDCVFNRKFSMDIMFLDANALLNVVDRDTNFGAACFLSGESASHVWRTFQNIWV